MSEIIKQDIAEKLTDSFLNYAKYVIADRALPDIRDGLKPVQRRVLYSMNNLGLFHNKSFKKSARVVGDCLGLLHPHGDTSVYFAMVNMAQEFTSRYPLVNGHGNFGSIDGDSPAAMRYTEAKLTLLGETMLKDLNKNTVDFVPNFDESFQEPTVLPTLIPNLLANGSTGIAVGMASSIPPHNISSLYEAIEFIIDKELNEEEVKIEDLIAIVKAPDFPTGGEIIDINEIYKGYKTGRGKAIIRSKYHIEEEKNRQSIVITEIPYKVNKARLIEAIDNLRRTTLEDIKEVRDESAKDIRIVIDLKKEANSNWIVKKLLKHTQMQDTFGMNMVALVGGKPKQFNLKEALEYFLAHVAEVIMRRTSFDLQKAQKRNHIIEGILLCLSEIDDVIVLIKSCKNNAEIISKLQESFSLSEEQAKSIADMKLRSLSQISANEYKEEYTLLSENIKGWEEILNDQRVLLETIKSEIKIMGESFKSERKTTIGESDSDINDKELIKDEDLVVTLTTNGLIKSVSEAEYSAKGRGAKGTKSGNIKEDDSIKFMIAINSRDDLLFFTNQGRCHVLPAYKVPISNRAGTGKYINNYLNLDGEEKVVSMVTHSGKVDSDLLFMTKNGLGKRLELSNLSTVRSITKVISFRDDDELVTCILMEKGKEVLIITAGGQAVRFDPDADNGKGIRPMGRAAAGVMGIKLSENDYVVGMITVEEGKDLLLMTEFGYSKKVKFEEFSTLSRGTKGIRCYTLNEKTGVIISAISLSENDDIFIVTKSGLLSRISSSGIRVMGRPASGVKAINLKEDDTVVTVSRNVESEED